MLPMIAAIESPEDREIMTEFYETYLNLLFRQAQKYVDIKEDAEDIVQEAFRRLIDKMDVFRGLEPHKQVKYAVVTVRNLCYLYLRDKQKLSEVAIDELLEIPDFKREHDPQWAAQNLSMAEEIQYIMSQIKTKDRMLLEQRFILFWTPEMMAQLHNVPVSHMNMNISRAKRRLFKKMQERNFQWTDWQE